MSAPAGPQCLGCALSNEKRAHVSYAETCAISSSRTHARERAYVLGSLRSRAWKRAHVRGSVLTHVCGSPEVEAEGWARRGVIFRNTDRGLESTPLHRAQLCSLPRCVCLLLQDLL